MKPWHAQGTEEALSELKTSQKGLTAQEAQARLATYGPNELKKEKGKSPLRLFGEQFTNVLIVILLIATGLSLVIGETVDALIILAIVIASASLGFIQEFRSEKAVEALKRMAAPTAIVFRDDKEIKIPATQLVPGDIILLYTGDKVPSDCRLLEAFNLKVEEAALTGESQPAEKSTKALAEETPLNDRRNLVFAGTIVAYGRAKAVVAATGMQTEFGKIAQMVQSAKVEETPLEKRMSSVGKWIGILAVVICVGVGAVGIIVEQRPVLDMVLWAVSLAVAAVPEALPAIVTGALAIGMYRMAKVNTIVKRLPAVETLGSTSVICSDKTGTMTKGEMTVQRVYVDGTPLKVSGIGYDPEGEFLDATEKKVTPSDGLKTLLRVAMLCNDSALERDTRTEKWIVKGDPTEGSLIVAAAKADLWKQDVDQAEPRIAEIPFSSERKRMTTIHLAGNRKTAYMKGAPEIVLEKCTKILLNGKVVLITSENRNELLSVTEAMAMQALRNLGFAYKELPESLDVYDEKVEEGFVFVGIMGMIDPPRSEVKDAIALCKSAGIRVVMITGDHKLTATAVAKALNLVGEDAEGHVLTGAELEAMTDEQLAQRVEDVSVYARVSPEHKMRIVKAWKKKDQVVAMTGDGVNDAPALKMADIGIAMGITGTEVTKEAAAMVLADDNFASIVKAVREGREIFDNIKKYLTYLLQCNIMEILVMFIAVVSVPYLARWLSPGSGLETVDTAAIALTAVQLLWLNLVTDGLPAIALGVDPGDPDLMERKPRKPSESLFSRDIKLFLSVMPIIMGSLLLIGYFSYRPWESQFQLLEGRTQLLTAMIVMELTVALCMRSFKYPVFKVGVFKNKFLWYALISSFALQLFILYTPGVQAVFDVHVPEPFDWAVASLFGAIIFSIMEIGKYVASQRKKQ